MTAVPTLSDEIVEAIHKSRPDLMVTGFVLVADATDVNGEPDSLIAVLPQQTMTTTIGLLRCGTLGAESRLR